MTQKPELELDAQNCPATTSYKEGKENAKYYLYYKNIMIDCTLLGLPAGF